MTRHETIFSVRYASVVLERHAAFHESLSGICRVLSLLSGSGVVAAIGAMSLPLSIVSGAIFAISQAIEYGIGPAERAFKSREMSSRYARLWAEQDSLSDDDMATRYRGLTCEDEITPSRFVKDLAYNQVLSEMGCDPVHAYAISGMHRVVDLLS